MIQTIILPDGTPLKFPAGMSDADIAAAIGAEYPQFAAKGGAPAAQEPEPIFRSPDGGRVYKGPDGMLRFVSPGMSTNNPETIAQIMGGSTPADASTYANVTTGGTAMAAGRSLLQGLTSAGGEEFVAKGISLLGGGGYAAELARERARIAKGRDEAPGTTIAAEVLGAMVSPVNKVAAPAAGLLRLGKAAPTLVARAADGVAQGAVLGGLYGFGSGEGGMENRAASAAKTAAAGAVFGAAVPYAMAGASKATAPIAGAVRSMIPSASPSRASAAIAEAVRRSGRTPEEIDAAMKLATADGQGGVYTIADAMGNAGQRALAGMVRQPSDARQGAVDFMMQRQADQADRVGGFLSDAMGFKPVPKAAPGTSGAGPGITPPSAVIARGTPSAESLEKALRKARTETAGIQYDAARSGAGPVDVRGALAVINSRVSPMAASGIKGDSIDSTLNYYRSRLAADAPQSTRFSTPGKPATSVELSDFSRILGVKQEVADDVAMAIRNSKGNLARELTKLQAELDRALEASSEGYRAANDTFAKTSRVMDAIDTGAGYAGVPRAVDTLENFRGLGPTEQAAARIGYGDRLLATVEGAAPGVNKVRPLTTTKNSQQLAAMATNPDQLGRQIARESSMFESGVAAMGGSKTADNMADAANMSKFSAPLIRNVVTGNFGTAGTQALQVVLDRVSGRNEATKALILKSLLGQDIHGAMTPAIQRAQQTVVRDITQILARAGVIVGASQMTPR